MDYASTGKKACQERCSDTKETETERRDDGEGEVVCVCMCVCLRIIFLLHVKYRYVGWYVYMYICRSLPPEKAFRRGRTGKPKQNPQKKIPCQMSRDTLKKRSGSNHGRHVD